MQNNLFFLTRPGNLKNLANDVNGMILLDRSNYDKLKTVFEQDPLWKYSKKDDDLDRITENLTVSSNPKDSYRTIIDKIAAYNSTRTPGTTKECMARYCSDPANHYLDRIKQSDVSLVDEMVGHLARNHERRDISLTSKVCVYLNDCLGDGKGFTKYDSVVCNMLPYYLSYYGIDDTSLWNELRKGKPDYTGFYRAFLQVKEKTELSNREMDLLIWYGYKTDLVRQAVGKACLV